MVENLIVAGVIVAFVSLLAYKICRVWFNHEGERHRLLHGLELDSHYKHQKDQIEKLTYASENWKARYRRLQRGDLEPDPDDDDEYLDDDDSEMDKLSDLARIIYPKLPKSLGKLIDKPELQEAMIKGAEKNPDAIASLIDKFTKKEPDAEGSKPQKSMIEYG